MDTATDRHWTYSDYRCYYESRIGAKLSEEDRGHIMKRFDELSAFVITKNECRSDPQYVAAWLAFIKLNQYATHCQSRMKR